VWRPLNITTTPTLPININNYNVLTNIYLFILYIL